MKIKRVSKLKQLTSVKEVTSNGEISCLKRTGRLEIWQQWGLSMDSPNFNRIDRHAHACFECITNLRILPRAISEADIMKINMSFDSPIISAILTGLCIGIM